MSALQARIRNILKTGIEGTAELVSYENKIMTDENGAFMVREAGTEYGVYEDEIPYNVFLNKIGSSAHNANDPKVILLYVSRINNIERQ